MIDPMLGDGFGHRFRSRHPLWRGEQREEGSPRQNKSTVGRALSAVVGGSGDLVGRVIRSPGSDGMVPETLCADHAGKHHPDRSERVKGFGGSRSPVPVFGGTAGEKGRVMSMAKVSKAKLRKRDLKRWEATFLFHKKAPPDGWKRYLRDGWSQGLEGWRGRYKRYLLSHAWRQRREGAIRRANGCCAMCEQPTDKPQVHHVDYMRVGAEQVEDLRVLCRSCHGVLHTMKRQPNIPMDDQTKAIMMAREYRERGRMLRQHAAALAAGEAPLPAPPDPDRPKVRRRPQGIKPAPHAAP